MTKMLYKNYERPMRYYNDFKRYPKREIVRTDYAVPKPVQVVSKVNPIIIKEKRIIYSREEMMKLRNNNYEMPKCLAALPTSIAMDFVLLNPSSLKSVPVVVSCFNNKGETVNKDKTNSVLNWERGVKVTKNIVNQHDNSYVPPKLRKTVETDEADLSAFKKTVQGVLNKLTPENLESCISEIEKLHVKTEAHLNLFVELVFTKAIQQESYCETYAKFSLRFCEINVNELTFWSILLLKCQMLYQTGLEKQIAEVKKSWAEKIAAEPNERMKVLYEESVEEHVKKEKDKFFGNLRFICELYLVNKLPLKLVLSVIYELLNESTDCTSLEAACRMLTVLGKKIESCDSKTLDVLFVKVTTLSVSKDLNMKTRFRLKDLIDMRKRNWQLRQCEMLKSVVPKTLSELKLSN